MVRAITITWALIYCVVLLDVEEWNGILECHYSALLVPPSRPGFAGAQREQDKFDADR